MMSPNLLKSQIPYVVRRARVPAFDGESNHERILNFKPCVYLAYFRNYGHLKIVKCIGMY